MSARHALQRVLLMSAVALAAGCATPLIQSVPAQPDSGQIGLFYALPMGQVQLIAERAVVDAEAVARAEKDAVALASGQVEQKALLDQATMALKDAKDLAAAAGPAAKDELVKRLAIAQASFDVQKTRLEAITARAAAARKIANETARVQGECRETASLTALPLAPDPQARYVMQHQTSAFRDDQLSVAVGANGLLGTTSAVATDQTRAVLLSVVEALAGFRMPKTANFQLFRKATPGLESLGAAGSCPVYKASAVFDPSLATEIARVQAKLKKANSQLGLCAAGLPEKSLQAAQAKPSAGFVYKGTRTVNLSIGTKLSQDGDTACTEASGSETATLNVVVPDATTRFVLPFDGVAFAKASTKHVFKDGMAVEFNVERNSSALAVASLPVDMLKALVSVPASIIKLRVDYETQSAAQINAQANVKAAELALINAQQKLEDRLKEVGGP